MDPTAEGGPRLQVQVHPPLPRDACEVLQRRQRLAGLVHLAPGGAHAACGQLAIRRGGVHQEELLPLVRLE
eukprot:190748-Prorocentrum_minimum.AAC.1